MKKKITEQMLNEIKQMVSANIPTKYIKGYLGVSNSTLWRAKKSNYDYDTYKILAKEETISKKNKIDLEELDLPQTNYTYQEILQKIDELVVMLNGLHKKIEEVSQKIDKRRFF